MERHPTTAASTNFPQRRVSFVTPYLSPRSYRGSFLHLTREADTSAPLSVMYRCFLASAPRQRFALDLRRRLHPLMDSRKRCYETKEEQLLQRDRERERPGTECEGGGANGKLMGHVFDVVTWAGELPVVIGEQGRQQTDCIT